MDLIAEAVAEALATHRAVVDQWLANRPGAWGVLAGQGVLAYRRRLGRKLTEAERRTVWAALWAALEARSEDALGLPSGASEASLRLDC